MTLIPCRDCGQEISPEAFACPRCGAPYPARGTWSGTGFEWRSRAALLGLPLVHVAFGRDAAGRARIAHGIVAVGQVAFGFLAVAQFGLGVLTIAQFGVGLLIGLGQFVLASTAVAQFAVCFWGEGWFLVSLQGGHPLFTLLAVPLARRIAHAGAFLVGPLARI